ncbi:uncharacterized protein LOC114526049 [Dendronephthya gigantea]|nr:uncharacterized protein LOC114526049 [Dendronephthya gigantea]
MVQILVADIIANYGDRPTAEVKISMAREIITEFPVLKDDEGCGYEAWYTPGKGIHSATGWLEERLRNVRKRSNEHNPIRQPKISTPSNLISSVTALPESTTTENEHLGMKEWLKQHTEPVSTVNAYMKRTVLNRAKWIRENSELPIRGIILEYPRLFDTPGMVNHVL